MKYSFQNSIVASKFKSYPPLFQKKLLLLRDLIFDVAQCNKSIGTLEEGLKWGEPAYTPAQRKSGVTVRIDWKKSKSHQYAMYFHCKTSLVQTFKKEFGSLFKYGGNRSIIFQESDKIPVKELSKCIELSLTYYTKI